MRRICGICGEPNLIKDIQASFRDLGLLQAIQRHDSDAIFDWVVEAISYQGIWGLLAFGTQIGEPAWDKAPRVQTL